MDSSHTAVVVTADELDGRLALVIGLLGPLYRGELTRGRLARRLAALGGCSPPRTPETTEFFVTIASSLQDRLLRNGHPPKWTEGHITAAVHGTAFQRLSYEVVAVARAELEPRQLDEVISHLAADILAPLLDRGGYVRLFGGDYGNPPHVPEAPDLPG